jgi:hypothetical protein
MPEVTLFNEGTQRRVLHSGIPRSNRPARSVLKDGEPVPDPGKLIIIDAGGEVTAEVADHVVDLIRSRPNDTLYIVGDRPAPKRRRPRQAAVKKAA